MLRDDAISSCERAVRWESEEGENGRLVETGDGGDGGYDT